MRAKPMHCSLPRVDASLITAEAFYEDHVATSTPLLICDDRLRRLKNLWTDELLEARFGSVLHDEVREAINGVDFPLTKVAGDRSSSMHVRDFLAAYQSNRSTARLYATNLVLPALGEDYPVPAFASLLQHKCAGRWCGGLWLGAGAARSPLHRDFSENVHGVIEGAKHFVLFAPNESAALYPKPERANLLGHTTRLPRGARTCSTREADDGSASGETACPRDFARFGGALERATVCRVEEGELLYVPSGWWHEVFSEGGSGEGGGVGGSCVEGSAGAASLRPTSSSYVCGAAASSPTSGGSTSASRGATAASGRRTLSINFWFVAEWCALRR